MRTRDAQVRVPGSKEGAFHQSRAHGGVSVCFASVLFCKLTPPIPDGAGDIVGIKPSVADERLSAKQSDSRGYWSLTEDQALFFFFALLCHNDAASLI